MLRRGFWLLSALALGGCSSGATAPAKPPGVPPTPATVTVQQPGGDAADPQAAALQRLLAEPRGQRGDKDQQLNVALPDPDNWKRVRYRGVDNFLGFRYGKEHYGMVVVFVQESEEEQPSSEECLRRFENWGRPLARPFDVEFQPFHPSYQRFRERPVIALSVDGELSFAFSRPKFSAAWAAYSIYPHACLISAVAVPWRENSELAQKVRDRFVAEGFRQLQPLTDVRPTRK
jgi:hypothetical protein